MSTGKTTLTECHQLLQDVMLEAFKIETLLFTPPYQDITKIDQGMRAAVWTHYYGNDNLNFGTSEQQYRILTIRSNLGFYNIILLFGGDTQPDFISLGPFRNEELSPNYFAQILKESHVVPEDIQRMKSIYENMPLVQLDAVTNVARHIAASYYPAFKDITPELIQYAGQERDVNINRDLLDSYSIEYAETYQKFLFSFLSQLKLGDAANSQKTLNEFLYKTNLSAKKSMREYKMILQTVNVYCHMALLQTSIHPLYIIKLAESFRTKIDNLSALTKLEQMPHEICRKYCLLVKNYSHPETSRLTKDVIAYIQLHLEDELSLSQLAKIFQKNASVLSNNFSKETGQTLTQFIHQTRIQEAIRLFNTTEMSVSEVSMAVGYPDFSYFSKVFSKNVGCSPREYKRRATDS